MPAPAGPATQAAAAADASIGLQRTVTHRLHTLQKLTDKVSQLSYLAEAGLPHGEGRCLAAIGAFAPPSINELARFANLDKSQASRSAQALVERGLVRKVPSPLDGRGVVLQLSKAGERVWQRVMAMIEARNAQIVACLDDAEWAQLDHLLDRLVAHARDTLAADERADERNAGG